MSSPQVAVVADGPQLRFALVSLQNYFRLKRFQHVTVSYKDHQLLLASPSIAMNIPIDGEWDVPPFKILGKHLRNLAEEFCKGDAVTIKLEDGKFCVGSWRTDIW